MKFHPSTLQAVKDCLQDIFIDKKYADKVIGAKLKSNPVWGSRDRRFIAETTYDIVRWYRLLQETAKSEDWDWIIATWFLIQGKDLPPLFKIQNHDLEKLKLQFEEAQKIPAVKASIPDELYDIGKQALPDNWQKELDALNTQASLVLRVNTLKIPYVEFLQLLDKEKVEYQAYIKGFPQAVVLAQKPSVFSWPSFQNGFFEIQDAGSQLIAPFLDVKPGMRVIDACAGAGGKSLHLAALMQNKGKLISMDTESYKLDELKRRAKRAGVHLIESKVIDSLKVIKRLESTADRLLLDVPCSGLGVLRRNPDAKWKVDRNFISEVKIKQAQILSQYAYMVKPGGQLVYATCSILPEENQEQVQAFLSQHEHSFELVQEHTQWPSMGFDGFYMACIGRKS